jgi:fatty acid synthase, animal type
VEPGIAGFRVLEVGCGTGGLTKDAVPILDKDGTAELLQYCATDVTPAFGPALLDTLRSQKLVFKVRIDESSLHQGHSTRAS